MARVGAAAPAETGQSGNPAFKASMYTTASAGQATMTVPGSVAKAMYFAALLIAGAVFGWSLVTADASGAVVWAWWTWCVGLAAFIVAIITLRNPQGAALSGSLYALLEGTVMGAVSAIYDVIWNGIVLQATVVTITIMLSVLGLYLFGVLRASPRFVEMIVIGTVGIALLCLFALMISMFDVDVAFWVKPTSAGVFWSLVIVALTALNFVLDFEATEQYSGGSQVLRMAGSVRDYPHARMAVPRGTEACRIEPIPRVRNSK